MLTAEAKQQFLLNTELELHDFLLDGKLSAIAEEKPVYKTNFIGSKQKLLTWILAHTPDEVNSVADLS